LTDVHAEVGRVKAVEVEEARLEAAADDAEGALLEAAVEARLEAAADDAEGALLEAAVEVEVVHQQPWSCERETE
jgi:hypothetical protein